MTDPAIDQLLSALPEDVVPEPVVAERIRARVAAELGDAIAADLPDVHEQEVQEVTILAEPTEDTHVPIRRRPPRLLLAAAAVVLVTLVGALVLAGGDDDSVQGVADADPARPTFPDPADLPVPATTPPDPTSTYAGGPVTVHDLTNPYRVAPGDDVVWVASLDGTVHELDPVTLEIGERFEISDSSLIAAGHGSLWVADAVTGQVLRYRGEGAGQVEAGVTPPTATIETGIRVDDRTVRDGRLGMLEGQFRQFARIGSITTGPGAVWVTDLEGRVLRIDPGTNSLVQSIAVDLEPHVVRSEGRHVVVGDQDDESAAVYDIVTGEEVFRLDGIGALIGVDLHRGAVLVHDGGAGTVTRYDIASGEVAATATLPPTNEPLHVPLFPPALRASDAGVVVPTEASVLILDPETLQVIRTLEVDGRAGEAAIGPDGTAWIVQFYGQTLTRLQVARG